MKRKKYISNWTILAIGLTFLFITGLVGSFLCSPANNSDVARWVKTNFFPADEFATISIMDASPQAVSSAEYKGSTSSAWVLSTIFAVIAFLIGFVILAKERGYFG